MTVLLMLIACVADVLDGALARLMRGESEFGSHFDSLSDAVTFGVAPSVIVLKTLSLPPEHPLAFVLTASALVYSICGVLRLVRFNVLSMRPKTEEEMLANKKHFTGLPIPAAAIATISANLFLSVASEEGWFVLSQEWQAGIMCGVLVVIGYFMVSRWKFPSVKTLHFRVPSFQLCFIAVLTSLFLLYGILYHFEVVFFALSWIYIVIAWIIAIIRVIAGKRSKTLADFEPDSEDGE